MKKAHQILAETFGWDIREVSEYRYQRYVSPAVYAIGDRYFAVSKSSPKHEVGKEWQKYGDQFFAEDNGTTVWVSAA